jgi:hypothetical protein
LNALTAGYIVIEGLDDDSTIASIGQADATIEGPITTLATLFEDEILPKADEGKDAAAPNLRAP